MRSRAAMPLVRSSATILLAAAGAVSLLAAFGAGSAGGAQIVWSPEERLSDDSPRFSIGPRLASTPFGEVCLVWADLRDDEWNYEIFFRQWNGVAWSPEEQLTFAATQSVQPDIASDEDGNLHVVWVDQRDGNREIYYKTGRAANWGPDERLSFDPAASIWPAVVAGGGCVYVFWQDDRFSPTQLYYRKRTSEGWGPETRLTDSPTYARFCSAAINPAGNLLVLWQTQHLETLMVHESFWNGSVWTHDLLVGDRSASQPTVACDPAGEFHAVIRTFDEDQAQLEQSSGDGLTWARWYGLTSIPASSGFPEISADSFGNLQVVWQDTRTGPEQIFIKYRPVLTGVWSEDEQVSVGGEGETPTVACDGAGRMVVVWTDGRDGSAEVYGRHGMISTGVEPGPASPVPVAVWPDPFREWICLRAPSGGEMRLDLLDSSGRIVLARTIAGTGSPVRLDLGNRLVPGVYFYRIHGAGTSLSGKLVHAR